MTRLRQDYGGQACELCRGRGYVGRGPHKDACPECAFEAEMEWRQHLKFEAMKARAEVTPSPNRVRRAA